MGRDLTKRYALPAERKGIINPFSFLRDIYRHGKVRELASFMVWELTHRLGLYPANRYLKFEEDRVLALKGQPLNQTEFGDCIDRLFRSRDLRLVRCQHNWKLLSIAAKGEVFGCLYPQDTDLYRCVDGGQSVEMVHRFPARIRSVFVSSRDTVFVGARGAVYRSTDGGITFARALDLGSPESSFRHNNGMTETPDGTLIVGEYGNVWESNGWRNLANLYFSADNGETWARSEFLKKEGINKHVHLVRYSSVLNRILLADGDNKKRLWLSDPLHSFDAGNPGWKPVNRFHIQMGGYTAMAEGDGTILFGTDYQGGTNAIVRLKDGQRFQKSIVPDPYRRSPIDNMVPRRSKAGDEVWANLPWSSTGTRCLLMYSANGGESWHKVLEYDRAAHVVWLISSSRETQDLLYFSIEDYERQDRVVYRVVDPS